MWVHESKGSVSKWAKSLRVEQILDNPPKIWRIDTQNSHIGGCKFYTLANQLSQQVGTWTQIEDAFPIEHGDIPASYINCPTEWGAIWNPRILKITG